MNRRELIKLSIAGIVKLSIPTVFVATVAERVRSRLFGVRVLKQIKLRAENNKITKRIHHAVIDGKEYYVIPSSPRFLRIVKANG